MQRYSLTHLADHVLVRDLTAIVAHDRETTAALLAHLAEVDARKLYLPAAYPSMHAYCVGALGLSEDAASKRIQVARVAHKCPALFEALADGRIHLSGAVLLAPRLTPENCAELLSAAAGRTRAEIERSLVVHFPKPDVPTVVQALAALGTRQHAPGHVEALVNPLPSTDVAPRPRLTPLAPERFALQMTVAQPTHDKLRYAQSLLGHAVPSGDLSQVLDRALDALIERLEQRRFAPDARSQPRGAKPKGRHIPAAVRREVWQRDGGQCTFASDEGRRCEARSRLEFDHATPVARGGETTVAGLRLRCRSHNQHAADCAFGAGFMQRKRSAARLRNREAEPGADLIPALRGLGFRLDEARRGAAISATRPDASVEDRLRLALSSLAPKGAKRILPQATSTTTSGPIPENSAGRDPSPAAILWGRP